MGSWTLNVVAFLLCFIALRGVEAADPYVAGWKNVSISVHASKTSPIPDNLLGVFFEEINHAGAGGLWAELIMNKGFEAGGHHSPSHIIPWEVIGDEKSIYVETEPSSCLENNKMALRLDVSCDGKTCPNGGVGIYNPGFHGMNIEEGKKYLVTFYARSSGPLELTASFVGEDGELLDTTNIQAKADKVKDWTKMEVTMEAKATSRNATFQLTTNKKGTIWLDHVSAMPVDTYKGHGFRKDLMHMLLDLKPKFIRFPGGCFVEGVSLSNAFRWKETIGPHENRPGHFNDIWTYWTDDGIGYLELLQMAEDLGAAPVWVVNIGIAHSEQVNTPLTAPFVKEIMDSLEFARGDVSTEWGSLRAKYGHPKPFNLRHVSLGNEDCQDKYTKYRGNYLKFYSAIKTKYPDIEIINNCDATNAALDVPADHFDFHIYTDPETMFDNAHNFDHTPRYGPKVFVSEYAVTNIDNPDDIHNNGTLMGALGEAAFFIGVERNSDIVSMASYAPLFMHREDPKWRPDAINFDSWHAFGIPSYWMQTFFTESSGATLLNVTESTFDNFIASAIRYKNEEDNSTYIKVKAVNFENNNVNLTVSIKELVDAKIEGSKQTVLTSDFPHDFNTFDNPTKVVPKSSSLQVRGNKFSVVLKPYSLTALDLLELPEKESKGHKKVQTHIGVSRSRKEGRKERKFHKP